MCFIPPDCLFCRHYNRGAELFGPDCAAFEEIPEAVFSGEISHLEPLPGDGGLRFELASDLADEYAEVTELRAEIQRHSTADPLGEPESDSSMPGFSDGMA